MISSGLYKENKLVDELKEELEVYEDLKNQIAELEGEKWLVVLNLLKSENKVEI
eukprot:CAMPEP_0116899624 /NCGR_PEP_ID=MMETSP0467-20121206/8134_1 /TAXON_ID=283647 /ORGANISM="Mesodinium pulex, Strain SPMC105" /LENGTH=53 /DNA_ID=CAMNT_0004572513 /DNA_START=316 /DNA_END=477 /DNA_ORIENTATION=-